MLPLSIPGSLIHGLHLYTVCVISCTVARLPRFSFVLLRFLGSRRVLVGFYHGVLFTQVAAIPMHSKFHAYKQCTVILAVPNLLPPSSSPAFLIKLLQDQ